MAIFILPPPLTHAFGKALTTALNTAGEVEDSITLYQQDHRLVPRPHVRVDRSSETISVDAQLGLEADFKGSSRY